MAAPPAPVRPAGLLIISEVRLLREGLARLLEERSSCTVLGSLASGDGLPPRVADHLPDVILIDMANLARPGAVAELRARWPAARLVAFAVPEEPEEVLACVDLSVAGIVGRTATMEELLSAVEGAREGEMRCSPKIATLMFRWLEMRALGAAPPDAALTERQTQILQLLGDGLSNKEIARRLSIRASTVKNHVHAILVSLQVRNRWQAGDLARERTRGSRRSHDGVPTVGVVGTGARM